MIDLLEEKDQNGTPGTPVKAAREADGGYRLPDDALILLPTRKLVMFPGMILPVSINRELSIAGTQYAIRSEQPVGLLLQQDPSVETPGPQDLYNVGTVASVLRHVSATDGSHHVICQGLTRFRVIEYLEGYPFLAARVVKIADPTDEGSEIEARFVQLRARALEALELMPQVPQEMAATVHNIATPGALADLIAGYIEAKPAEKQIVLQTLELERRLDAVLALLAHRIDVLRLSAQIGERTKASMDDRQREFMLREQLKSIQKELGEGEGDEGKADEIAALRQAISEAGMPEDTEKQALKELKRLERMSDSSGENAMLRTYIDWLVELPWKAPEADAIDMAEARRILDADHFGLESVKKRILEFLAVRKLNPAGHGPILCFVGPPGVGKTSLGQSIARALGRKFVRVSLGGVHDEAEIRGHRRTYIGALPGNVIQAMKKAGTRGAVMMFDEIDKLGAGNHGDPSSAMLEVLDPEQNNSFRDNYLGLPYDLSSVLFIATANVLDAIPGPLRDRMEVIQLPGYTQEEKREIARRYLVARQFGENGLKPGQAEITDAALAALISDYTREAGVRGLERQIGALCRRAAVRIADGGAQPIVLDRADLDDILGAAKYDNEMAERPSLPGVATGLAWTPVGGDILFIEASRTPGSGKLILTGQLGDVMKESVQAALTLVKSRAASLALDVAQFEKTDIHVHVPAGGIPKDGPSAGVAMFIALASLFADKAVRSEVAMTGEISLRGVVLPVGGVKDKVLAAMRAGIRTVMLPARNKRDLDEVPLEAREKLQFVWLDTVDDAMRVAMSADATPSQLSGTSAADA